MIRRMLMLSGLFVVLFATAAHAQYVPGEPGIIVDPSTVQVGGTIAAVGQRMLESVGRTMMKQALESLDRELKARLANSRSAT